jgi:hypothetical protein
MKSFETAIETVTWFGKLHLANDSDLPSDVPDVAHAELGVVVNFDFEGADGDGWNEPRTPAHCTVTTVTWKCSGNPVPDRFIDHFVEEWEERALEQMSEEMDPDNEDGMSPAAYRRAMQQYRGSFA